METAGQRNLVVLGVVAILVAGATTSLSLWLYRKTGDIYLDRSRPGYLPDEKEVEEEASTPVSGFIFSENGDIDKKTLDEYLKEYKIQSDRIKALADPYAPGPLSDESLGITAVEADPEDLVED